MTSGMKFGVWLSLMIWYLSMGTVSAFMGRFSSASLSSGKLSIATDEAVAIYSNRYPFNRPPPPPASRFGLPLRDLDGTTVLLKSATTGERKRLTDLSEKQVRANFVAMAKVYGEDQALEMVRALPVALSFNAKNFAPTLTAFAERFGEEESKAMVLRNPGLLAVSPDDAATTTDQTMIFSYLVGYTRPFGNILLPTLFGLLLIPLVESILNIPFRQNLWNSLGF